MDSAMRVSPMLWFERDKERHRFYLLPGMGGRALRRKQLRFLYWSLAIGLVVSAVLTVLLFILSRPR